MINRKNHRRSIRLKGYDYSQNGLYFITICIHHNINLLGEVVDGKMRLNCIGKMIEKQWLDLSGRFEGIKIDEYVLMPNHFHGIIEFSGNHLGQPQRVESGQPQGIAPTGGCCRGNPLWLPLPTVGDVVGAFKSLSTNEYIRQVKDNNWPRFDKHLWQRNYYEHIIRNEESYRQISQYMQDNPIKWLEDKYYT
ncbi:MAG: hypothetical protein QM500_11970 [Methylococcales bacterium]